MVDMCLRTASSIPSCPTQNPTLAVFGTLGVDGKAADLTHVVVRGSTEYRKTVQGNPVINTKQALIINVLSSLGITTRTTIRNLRGVKFWPCSAI